MKMTDPEWSDILLAGCALAVAYGICAIFTLGLLTAMDLIRGWALS